eukprot:CAMPEP_0206469524 /NCGR_PEP_ID=MMETSP0324_2-20121206/30338_1 /ASSEMBLY_ACC=CAM_ASM_000836 /TAXON_ID=2866 /ORGANISM="Crypthecodinium cohnii, Strain Seligo" /LENGTH=303 /DNA_ID=CAMNT_0053943313 /DNA_START=184 /DNA_END=1095 /DNA_ORIENTATION=-
MASAIKYLNQHMRWYHWVGGIAMTGAVNCGIGLALGETYRWVYRDDEKREKQFRQQYGTPSEVQRLEVFRYLAKDWDTVVGFKEKRGADSYRHEMLKAAKGDVLDVACGVCPSLLILKTVEGVKSFVGVDIVEEMVEEAKPRLEQPYPFPARVEVGNAHKLNFPDNSFDTVICTMCLCSLEDPAKGLEEMARVCRKDGDGGRVLIVEPGVAKNRFIREGQRYFGIVPQLKHAWEFGWHDDLDPISLVRNCPSLEVESWSTKVLGNWYLIVARPKLQLEDKKGTDGAVAPSPVPAPAKAAETKK